MSLLAAIKTKPQHMQIFACFSNTSDEYLLIILSDNILLPSPLTIIGSHTQQSETTFLY